MLDFIAEVRRENKTNITAPHAMLTDYNRLIECDLIHERRHKHASTEYAHHHLHPAAHEHEE